MLDIQKYQTRLTFISNYIVKHGALRTIMNEDEFTIEIEADGFIYGLEYLVGHTVTFIDSFGTARRFPELKSKKVFETYMTEERTEILQTIYDLVQREIIASQIFEF